MNFSGINFGQMAGLAATAAGKNQERDDKDSDTKSEKDRAIMRDLFKHKAIEMDRKPKGNEKSYLA